MINYLLDVNGILQNLNHSSFPKCEIFLSVRSKQTPFPPLLFPSLFLIDELGCQTHQNFTYFGNWSNKSSQYIFIIEKKIILVIAQKKNIAMCSDKKFNEEIMCCSKLYLKFTQIKWMPVLFWGPVFWNFDLTLESNYFTQNTIVRFCALSWKV